MASGATAEGHRMLARLQDVQANYESLAKLRREAMLAALQAGHSLRAGAGAANCSYESVRRIAEPHAVIFSWRGLTYLMTEHVTRVLEYKAAGFARGAFPADVADLGAGRAWLKGAADLARELQRVQQGEVS